MRPRTISASSLKVAELCLARYGAENMNRAKSVDNEPALTGSAVHGGLEHYVKAVFIEKRSSIAGFDSLKKYYDKAYMEVFNTAELSGDTYDDGLNLIKIWFARTDLSGVEVVSAEQKLNFPVPTSIGNIPFTYIIDRLDRLGSDTIRVVDYKTLRAPMNVETLHGMIQGRAYGLATAIQFKGQGIKHIWVQMDMLRHDAPVAVKFTREDNAKSWEFFKRAAQRLVDADETNLPETLNSECRFCVRKLVCKTLNAHVRAGGPLSLSPEKAAERLYEVQSQIKALESIQEQCDQILLQEAEKMDMLEWEVQGVGKVEITASKRRSVRSDQIALTIPKELVAKYGTFNVGNVDKLLKEPSLTEEQRKAINQAVFIKWGDPRAKVSPISPSNEE